MRQKTPLTVIVSEAERLIRKAGTRDPEKICEALGIRIHYMDLQQKIKAFYFYQSRINNIVVDEHVTEDYRRILLAHELGHCILHRETAMMKGFQEMEVLEKRDAAPLETEANYFAAELLIPDEEVLPLLSSYSFFETASALQVPSALLDFKFSLLGKCKGYTLSPIGVGSSSYLKKDEGVYETGDLTH